MDDDNSHGLLPVSNDDPIYACELEDDERNLLKQRTLSQKSWRGLKCAAPNCNNTRYKNPALAFHKFPKDLDRCKQWMNYSQRDFQNKSLADIAGKLALCENHFEHSQYMDPTVKGSEKKWKKLIHNALPTIFDVSNPRKPISEKRKQPALLENQEKSCK